MALLNNKSWVVYLVQCSDNSLYCGVSNDLENRLIEHNAGKGAKYTRSRRPVELVGVGPEMPKSEAFKMEYRIKKLPANMKIYELIGGNEMTLKQDLRALQKEFKDLGKKVEMLTKAVEKAEKAQTNAARDKIVKKAPAKKKATPKKATAAKNKTTKAKKPASKKKTTKTAK